VKLAGLERHLREHDCVLKRQGGNHAIWERPDTKAWTSVPRHREIKDYLVRGICKQLDIPVP
jgi:predicted RNA binding protein YcfA (HicA-like mRNA interferase family)